MAVNEQQILDQMTKGADASYKTQQAMADKSYNDTVSNLQSQYDEAVANGEISIRDAENQFAKQKEEIDNQHYLNTQATNISANDMGLQNSMQFQGLQRGDNLRRNSAVNKQLGERDIKINDIRTRLKSLEAQKNRDITMAGSNRDLTLMGARGQIDMQKAQAMSEFLQQNYFMDKEQANQIAMQQLGFAHDSAMQQAGFSHDKQMSALEFSNAVKMKQEELKLQQKAQLDEYDLAAQRELAKYTPGTPEYNIIQGQLRQERQAMLTEMATANQFEVISKDIISGGKDPGPKPKRSDFNKFFDLPATEEKKFQKALAEWEAKSAAYKRYQEYSKDPMSAFTNSGGLGSLSAKYESNGNPGAIGRNAGDKGGASYGAYQMTTNSGNAQSFANSYGGALKGKKAGTKAFDDAWKAEAKKNPQKFLQAQHNYIANSHYKPALTKINKAVGFDMSKYPKAVQDVIWSVAVQHGSGGAANVFKKAGVKKGDSPLQIINKVYNVRHTFFGSSSKSIQNSVKKRFEQERKQAIKMLNG